MGDRVVSGYQPLDPRATLSTESFTLQMRKVAASMSTDPVWLDRVELHETNDLLAGRLAHTITAYVLANHLATDQRVVFSTPIPTSWWQHTKIVAFPTLSRWLRRPPRTRRDSAVVTADTFATFPQATVPYPERLGPMRIVQDVRWDQIGDAGAHGATSGEVGHA
jgi:hypothetical protein